MKRILSNKQQYYIAYYKNKLFTMAYLLFYMPSLFNHIFIYKFITTIRMATPYVNPESFRLELISSNVNGKLTPNCISMLLLMVDRIQRSFVYVDEQDKEDCASEAISVVLHKWQKYDVTRQNPFAYFTRMIYNGLYAGWNKLNKSRTPFSYSNIFTEST